MRIIDFREKETLYPPAPTEYLVESRNFVENFPSLAANGMEEYHFEINVIH